MFGKLGIGSRKQLRAALSDVEQPSSAANSHGGPTGQADGDRRD
jgi:hypothetical protein